MAAELQLDWEAIERDYRAGILTLRELAEIHGGSHVTIARKAKKEAWERDLSARVAARAEALVTRAAVTADETKRDPVSDRQAVEATAQVIAAVILSQHASIRRNRALSEKLLNELEAQCDNPEMFAQLGELMASPDEKGVDRLNDIYKKVIGLPSRIDSAKKLAETVRILIGLEREAYHMDSDRPADTGMSGESVAVLKRLKARLEANQ